LFFLLFGENETKLCVNFEVFVLSRKLQLPRAGVLNLAAWYNARETRWFNLCNCFLL